MEPEPEPKLNNFSAATLEKDSVYRSADGLPDALLALLDHVGEPVLLGPTAGAAQPQAAEHR